MWGSGNSYPGLMLLAVRREHPLLLFSFLILFLYYTIFNSKYFLKYWEMGAPKWYPALHGANGPSTLIGVFALNTAKYINCPKFSRKKPKNILFR